MKVKYLVYSPNFVEEIEYGKNTHGHVIFLDSIKYSNNFVFKKSKNMFKSNENTNFNPKKKKKKKKNLILNPHVYILYDMHNLTLSYDSYDMHLYIE